MLTFLLSTVRIVIKELRQIHVVPFVVIAQLDETSIC